jgi:predicted membrane-bound dolichyl-phosphate-mannose-protein mannosyltransferase
METLMTKFHSSLVIACIMTGLYGCSNEDTQSTAVVSETAKPQAPVATVTDKSTTADNSSSEIKATAKEWTEKTGELASEAWNVTKDKSSEVGEKSKEIYEAAKDKTLETSETVADKSKEYYEVAKDKTAEVSDAVVEKSKAVYESGKQKGTELLNDMNNK